MPIKCPCCLYTRSWIIRREKRKCKSCRREFSIKIYPITGIRSIELDWQKCIHAFLRQRASLQVASETGIGHCRAAVMVNLLRMVMYQDVPALFTGPVELDETYIGGQRKNKKLHIRRIRGKSGHGTEKLPIMAIFDRASKQIYTDVLPKKLNMEHIFKVMNQRVLQQAQIFTDGLKMYRGLKHHGWKHEYVDHDGGEYVRGQVHTNNVEGFFGILKRKLGCIGGMRRDRLYLFVAEIAWRFNHRNQSLDEQEQKLINLVHQIGGRIQ